MENCLTCLESKKAGARPQGPTTCGGWIFILEVVGRHWIIRFGFQEDYWVLGRGRREREKNRRQRERQRVTVIVKRWREPRFRPGLGGGDRDLGSGGRLQGGPGVRLTLGWWEMGAVWDVAWFLIKVIEGLVILENPGCSRVVEAEDAEVGLQGSLANGVLNANKCDLFCKLGPHQMFWGKAEEFKLRVGSCNTYQMLSVLSKRSWCLLRTCRGDKETITLGIIRCYRSWKTSS